MIFCEGIKAFHNLNGFNSKFMCLQLTNNMERYFPFQCEYVDALQKTLPLPSCFEWERGIVLVKLKLM